MSRHPQLVRPQWVARGTALTAVTTLVATVTIGCGATTAELAAPTTTAPTSALPQTDSGAIAPSTSRPISTLSPGTEGPGEPVTIVFGGDIHYDGPLASRLASNPSSLLAGVQSAFEPADLVIANLETSIGTDGTKAAKQFSFRAPPAALTQLTSGGVDVIGMANNHALDFGQTGFAQTLSAISDTKAPVIGVGANEDAAFAPFMATIKGNRIAVINATQVIDSNLIAEWTATDTNPGVASAKHVDRLIRAVSDARSTSDTVIVFLHWGTEKQTCPDANQLALAPQLVEAGADVVVGGHAHRVQGGGYLGSAYVEYGLGNLQFKAGSAEARTSGLLRLSVDGRKITSSEWLPVRIDGNYLPQLLTGSAKTAANAAWETLRACAHLSDTSA